MDQSPKASGNVATFALCFLGSLVEGYDLQAAAVAMRKLIANFELTPAMTTWVPTSNTIGLLIGAVIGGWLADRIGRKPVLIASMLAFGIFSVGTALAPDANILLLMRFLVGLGLGGAMPNIISLVAETGRGQSAKQQTAKVTALTAGIPFGGFLSTVLALSMGPDFPWEVLFHVGGWAPIAIALLMIPFLKESPVFLRNRAAAKEDVSARPVSSAAVLFGEGRALGTVMLWAAFLFTLIVLYLLLNWLPLLMGQKGFSPVQATLVAGAFSVGGAAGAIGLGALMGWSRKIVMTGTYVLMAVSVFVLGSVGANFGVALAAGFAVGFFVIGSQYLLYGLSPTLYPSAVRGTGVGWGVSIGRIGAVIGPFLAGSLLAGGATGSEVIMAILPAVLIGGAAAVVLAFRKPVDYEQPAPVQAATAAA